MIVEPEQLGESVNNRKAVRAGFAVLRGVIRVLITYLLPPAVVAGGVMGAIRLYETGPKARRRAPQEHATLVQVETVEKTCMNAAVQVMGTVTAAQEVVLQPRVSGEIVQLSPKFVPGGRFDAGEFILQIDPKDYELAVQRARSQVAQAEYELKLEQGQQEIARREWDLLGMGDSASALDRELALRRPHLNKANAAMEAAAAALREAQLNLERTTIRAPFNGIVTTENVDLGAQVNPQTQLGTLVGTHEYWVRASVPVDELNWIRFPGADGQEASTATACQKLGNGSDNEWEGRVVRLMGDLEPQGRMARVLISVRDPLGRCPPERGGVPLLIGAYVNVVIKGREIEEVVALPRAALRDGEKVWIMSSGSRLKIRDVEIAWANRDLVAVRSGIQPGERLVVSDLGAPVSDMRLTLGGSPAEGPAENELACRAAEGIENAQSE